MIGAPTDKQVPQQFQLTSGEIGDGRSLEKGRTTTFSLVLVNAWAETRTLSQYIMIYKSRLHIIDT